MAKVIKTERIYENRWFWVVAFAAVILVSAIAGFYSAGGNVEGTIETVKYANKATVSSKPEQVAKRIREINIARSFERVLKLIQEGVIQRLDEPTRRLYVNDPVWEVMGQGRKEHVARVVAEYLDWVHNSHTGHVYVHSFRNGGLVAAVSKSRTFVAYR